MALTPERLAEAKQAAACCALTEGDAAVEAQIHGDAKCAQKHRMRAAWLLSISYRLCDPCLTDSEKEDLIRLLDCECNYGGCRHDEVPDCTLVADYTVLDAVDQADLPVYVAEDDAYYLLDGANVGEIATWDGDEWIFTSVPDGSVILASDTGVYYTNLGSGPGPLFPRPLITNVSGPPLDYWYLTLLDPQTAQDRDIQLQGLGPNGWYNIDIVRNEAELPSPQFNLTGLQYSAIRLKYIVGDCLYYSQDGEFMPPIVPPSDCTIIPDYTAVLAVDANDQGAFTSGIYFIVTNQYSVANEWADNVGSIVVVNGTSYTYTPVPIGHVVYITTGGTEWWMTSAGAAPLFPPLTITYGVGQYTVSSDYPAQSAVGTRFMIVYDDNLTIVWSGFENQLPEAVPSTSQFTEPITVRYFNTPECYYEVPASVVQPDPVPVEFECDEDNLYQYRYTDVNPQQLLFTAPAGQVPTVQFAAGGMDALTVIFIYDGPSNTDPILISGSYADLAGVVATGTTEQVLLEVIPSAAMADDLLTWLFQVSCVTTQFIAATIVTDDCDTYQYNVSVEALYGGGVDYNFEVYVNASTTPILFGPYSGEATYDLGDYPIGSQVSVIMRNDADPTDYLWLGIFETNGDCPDDPCAPIPDFIVRLEDCASFNNSGDPYPGILFLAYGVQSTCPSGITIGGIYMWDTDAWVEQSIPVGSVILGDDGTYYVEVSAGVVIPYFQLTIMGFTGNTPLNVTLHMPAIQQFGITTNRPVAIQTSLDGVAWTTIWSGNEQDLAQPLAVAVPGTLTQMRSVWWPETCAFYGPVQILS